jgi:hypothetical protein
VLAFYFVVDAWETVCEYLSFLLILGTWERRTARAKETIKQQIFHTFFDA